MPSRNKLLVLPRRNAFYSSYLACKAAFALSTNALTLPLNALYPLARPSISEGMRELVYNL